ncbi:hypothetical protein IRJ34_16940 [Paenarthrobacter sp. GOM3]|uniref:hypothetical protein n=1 Tax=Paenarthrobacter sp. GOM3 TaxID=2782567 RepID=UPI001BA90B68|nr:hypothetical protein [Paenarthrobacter sp. GOM3]WOH18018.1 hypothetical protein IRJ34_16940 [Paenarthrobacter sp. GOM3]
MITMDSNLAAMHHEALQRQARQRVDLLDELRAVQNVANRNFNQRDIAEILVTSQAKVHRLLKAIERRGGDLSPDPEEVILRAFAYDTSRHKLVADLKAFAYTFGEDAPYPHEGRMPGTWDQVVVAVAHGLLSETEFQEVRAAIGR